MFINISMVSDKDTLLIDVVILGDECWDIRTKQRVGVRVAQRRGRGEEFHYSLPLSLEVKQHSIAIT